MSQGRHLAGSLFQLLALVLVDSEAHTIHDNHIVIIQMIEIIGCDFTQFDHRIIVGMRNLSQRNSLIVEESDAGSTHPGRVSLRQTSQNNHDQQGQEDVFLFNLFDFSYSFFHIYSFFRAAKVRVIEKLHNTEKL